MAVVCAMTGGMVQAESANGSVNYEYTNYNAETGRSDVEMTITGPVEGYKPCYVAGTVGALKNPNGEVSVTAPAESGITETNRPLWVENATVNMEGGSLCYLTAGASSDGAVYGDRTVNMSGGCVNFLFGSDLILSDTKPSEGYFASNPDQKPMVSSGNVTINVSGGTVTHSLGAGVNFSGPSPLNTYIEENGGISAFAVKGDATINISGTAVIGGGSMDEFNAAGGRYASVDGKLTVNVSGGSVNSDLFCGARGAITNSDGSIDRSYVGSAEVNITGGEINADVYGGNSYSGSGGGAGYTKGNVVVNVSGGVVDGNVYGGGDRDEVQGNTKVVLSGGEITGNVYGAGHKNKVGKDTEILIKGDVNVGGNLYGGGTDGATVQGARKLTVEAESNLNTVGDFSLINVKKDTTIAKIENAAEGTTLRNGAVLTVNSDLTVSSYATNASQTEQSKLIVNGDFTVNGKNSSDKVHMAAYGLPQSVVVSGKTTIDTASSSTFSNKAILDTASLDIQSSVTLNGKAQIVAEDISVSASLSLTDAAISSHEGKEPAMLTVLEDGQLTLNANAKIQDLTLDGGKVTVSGKVTAGSITLNEGMLTFDARNNKETVINMGGSLTLSGDVSIVLLVSDLDAVLGKEFVLFEGVDTLDSTTLSVTMTDGTSSAELEYAYDNGKVTTALPEPTTATLSLLALAALAARRRRK